MLGPLIVDYERLEDDPVYKSFPYKYDYPMLIMDWFHERNEDLVLHYMGPYGSFDGYVPKYPWPHSSVKIDNFLFLILKFFI